MDLEPRADDSESGDRTETIVPKPGSSDSSDSGRRRLGSRTPSGGGAVDGEAEPPLDQLIDGDPDRYASQGEHARGGLGRVLRARDHRLGRTVAIKELLRTTAGSEARFVREALITARLQHPSIVPVHEAGRWPNGDPYYVMKLISGRSLKEMIRDRPALGDRLALLPNVIAVAEAIAYAHSEGVIHRDIKPANVMIGEFGETVVVDWGIAKDRRVRAGGDAGGGAGEPMAGQGATAGVLGTPAYMAPEQACGEEIDERADVYALGALLYELLAGAQPYARTQDRDGGDSPDSGDLLARVLAGPPRPVEELEPGVPPELLAVVRKAMERERAARYAGAKAFAEDLKRYQTGALVTAHQYSTLTLVKRWMWRNRALVAVAALALAVVALFGVLGVSQVIGERNAARAERTQAEQATRITETKRLQLLMLQARSSLDRDPTAAVAWLKTYPETGPAFPQIRAMIDDAETRGVARHVFRLQDWGLAIAFSPGRPHLAAVGRDKKVRVFDTRTGASTVLATLAETLHAVAFSPDGRALAVGGERGSVATIGLRYDGEDALPSAETPPRVHASTDGEVGSVVFSPSGTRLASIAKKGSHYRILDAATMESLEHREGRAVTSADGRFVLSVGKTDLVPTVIEVDSGERVDGPALPVAPSMVAVAAGGTLEAAMLAAVDEEGWVRLYERGSKAWRDLGRHPTKVDNVQFSPSRRLVATMGYDKTIRLMPTAPPAGDEKVEPRILRGHEDAIYMVVFSPDERMMVSAGDDATARVWDLESGHSRALRGHEDDVYAVALSRDGTDIGSVSLDGTVRVWNSDVGGGRVLGRTQGAVGFVWFAGAGQVMTHSYSGGVQLWDVASGETRAIGSDGGARWLRRPMIVSREGRRTAAIYGEGRVQVWDVEKGESFELVADTTSLGYATSVELAPSGARAVVSYRKGAVMLWDLEARTPTVLARGELPSDASFAPDGSELAVAHAGGVTRWDLGNQEILGEHALVSGGGAIRPEVAAYSPDGRWLALASMSRGHITLLERASGQLRSLHADDDMFTDIAFSPDGRWLATAGTDRQVRLWSCDSGELRILSGHRDLVMRVAFSPDSRTLASASYDKTARLWPTGGGEARILRGHAESIDTIAFSPDGATLVTGSRDGTARLWPIANAFAGGSPAEIDHRLRALTTAVIARDDRPETVR